MDRIVVVGTSCSGKTTLATELAARAGAPHIHLDALYWLSEWRPRPLEEFRELVGEAVSGDRWVADGNYGSARDLVWTRATAVVWLNYPFRIVMTRALRRTIGRVIRGEELFAGNRETVRKAFLSRDSILLWVLKTHGRNRREYRGLLDSDAFPGLTAIELRHPAETQRFLREWKS